MLRIAPAYARGSPSSAALVVAGVGVGGGGSEGRRKHSGIEIERKETPQGRDGWEDGTPPQHRDLKERSVQTQIPSTGDAVGFPTRGSTHGAILDDNTSSSLQYRTPFPSASRSAAVRSSSCAARLSTCGAPCAHRW